MTVIQNVMKSGSLIHTQLERRHIQIHGQGQCHNPEWMRECEKYRLIFQQMSLNDCYWLHFFANLNFRIVASA